MSDMCRGCALPIEQRGTNPKPGDAWMATGVPDIQAAYCSALGLFHEPATDGWPTGLPPAPAYGLAVPADVPPPVSQAELDIATLGAELLGYVRAYFAHHVAFPSPAALNTVTLWVAHALARDRDDTGLGQLIWRATPRLMITSAENQSGKSTVLDLISYLLGVPARMPKITGRSIAEKLGRKHQAVILDEVKLLFGSGMASKDVQGVLLAGYTPGAVWSYTSGGVDRDIPCYGPCAYAARDELITALADELADLFSRSIKIRMYRPPVIMPEVDEMSEEDGALLGESLAGWCDAAKPLLITACKALAMSDRAASIQTANGGPVKPRGSQIWRPLQAIATVAGGPWPQWCDEARAELSGGGKSSRAVSAMPELRRRAANWSEPVFAEQADPKELAGVA